MRHLWLRWYLLPVVLGALGLLLLVRILFIDSSGPNDIDVVVLLALLGLAMVVAIHSLVRISINHLRTLSVQRTRQETLAEHVRFLRRLDHELKNPLTTLRTGMTTLALTELDVSQRRLVATMESEAMRLSRLVTDLRKLAEMETQPLNLQSVDLSTFVLSLCKVEQERFEEAERVLAVQLQQGRSHWTFDEDLLSLALHNLLDNALKYTKPGDKVSVEFQTQQELTIRVSDTGHGIPSEALPHVWEELYRAHGSEVTMGSGIGLALVKAIIERHGGIVSIESRLGEGTSVSLSIPPLSSQ